MTSLLEPEARREPPSKGPPTAVGLEDAPRQPSETAGLWVVTYADLQDYLILQKGVRVREGLEDVSETLMLHRFNGRHGWYNGWRHFEAVYWEWYSGKVDIEVVRSLGGFGPLVNKVPQDGMELEVARGRGYMEKTLAEQFWCMRNRPSVFAKYDRAVHEVKSAGAVSFARKLDWRPAEQVAGIRVTRGVFEVPAPLEDVIERFKPPEGLRLFT